MLFSKSDAKLQPFFELCKSFAFFFQKSTQKLAKTSEIISLHLRFGCFMALDCVQDLFSQVDGVALLRKENVAIVVGDNEEWHRL